MNNITASIQEGKGAAIHRLLQNAEKAEKVGDVARARRFREAAQSLKNECPTIWS